MCKIYGTPTLFIWLFELMRDRVSSHILPHRGRGLCTEEQPSCTCSAFCNHSCSHKRSAHDRTLTPVLPYRRPEGEPWTGNWIVLSCCCQPTESSASFLVWQPSKPHVSLYPFHIWLLLCLLGNHLCKSTRDTLHSWEEIYGMNTCCIYSSNILAPPGFIIKMMAAPSSTAQVASRASVWAGDRSSRHIRGSLLVPSHNLPPSESADGHAWFSCWKKSSRFPSLVWQLR